jgi:hypothetical protein
MASRRTGRPPEKVFSRAPDDETEDAAGQTHGELIQSARKSLMDAIPGSAKALADGASSGSVPHIKLLLQLVGLDDGELAPETVRPREKTLEEILMEQWRKEP